MQMSDPGPEKGRRGFLRLLAALPLAGLVLRNGRQRPQWQPAFRPPLVRLKPLTDEEIRTPNDLAG